MSAKKKVLFFGKFLTYIALLLFVVAIIGFIAVFTNGFTSDFKTFYVKNGKQLYTQDSGEYPLSTDEELRFDVKYTFDMFSRNDTPKGYTVKVVSNATDDTAFAYSVCGNTAVYANGLDLSAAFGLKTYDTYFTMSIPSDISMQSVLTAAYDGETVTVEDIDLTKNCYFTLVITAYNNESTVRINFTPYTKVTSVEFEKEGIIL